MFFNINEKNDLPKFGIMCCRVCCSLHRVGHVGNIPNLNCKKQAKIRHFGKRKINLNMDCSLDTAILAWQLPSEVYEERA